MAIKLATFTPAQAARISGVNATLQRDWRRRGFLPREDGHARFTLYAVADLLVLNVLAQRGIGPQQAQPVVRSCGVGVVAGALRSLSAYSGDVGVYHPDAEEVFRDRHVGRKHITDDVLDYWWQQHWVSYLRKMTMRPNDVRDDPETRFVWWADGSTEFAGRDVLERLDDNDPRQAGAVVLLNFNSLGDLLIARAGGPVADVEVSDRGKAMWSRCEEQLKASGAWTPPPIDRWRLD